MRKESQFPQQAAPRERHAAVRTLPRRHSAGMLDIFDYCFRCRLSVKLGHLMIFMPLIDDDKLGAFSSASGFISR